VCDCDKVVLSNLNRQVIHSSKDLGKKKAESAKEKLERLNPNCKIIAVCEKITGENAAGIFAECDAIVDCLDNLETRKTLNKLAIERKIPLFHAAVEGLEGRVAIVVPNFSSRPGSAARPRAPQVPNSTSCLECIYGSAEGAKGEFPILGSVAGAVGAMLATEVFKFFALGGKPHGELLVYDAKQQKTTIIRTRKRPNCAACGHKKAKSLLAPRAGRFKK